MFCQSGGRMWKAEGWQLAGTEISAFEICCQQWGGGRNYEGGRNVVAVLNIYGDCCAPGWFQKTGAPWPAAPTLPARAAARAEHPARWLTALGALAEPHCYALCFSFLFPSSVSIKRITNGQRCSGWSLLFHLGHVKWKIMLVLALVILSGLWGRNASSLPPPPLPPKGGCAMEEWLLSASPVRLFSLW